MSIRPVAIPFFKNASLWGLLVAAVVGVGFAFAPMYSLIALSLLSAFVTGFFVSPFILFGLYYGVSLAVTGIPLWIIPVSLNQLLFIAFFGSLVRQAFDKKLRIPNNWPFYAFVGLAGLMIISALSGESWELGLLTAKSMVTLSSVSAGVALLMTSPARARLIFWAFIIPTALNGCVGMVEAIVNDGFFETKLHFAQGYFRINGISPNSIVLAQGCLFAFPMSLYLARHGLKQGERIVAGISAAFLLAVVARTLNLQNLVIVPVLVWAAAAFFRGQIGRWIWIGSIVAALVAGPFIIAPVSSRLQKVARGDVDESLRLRQDNITNALRVHKANPWFGAGLGSYQDAWWPVRSMDTYYNQYEEIPRQQDVDFNYFLLLAETGTVGFAIHLLYYFGVIILLWRWQRRMAQANHTALKDLTSVLLLLWLQYLVSGFTQDNIFHMRSWLIFGMSAALMEIMASSRAAQKY